MSIIVDSSHTFLSSYSNSPFSASEEIFTLIDHKNCISYIFVHEKRRLNSRAIIRVVDYKNKIAKEERSRTLRFKIKSTFASLPYSDEAITFTGGGFTSSVIAKTNTYMIVAAAPSFILPNGKENFKAMLSFSINPKSLSYNQLFEKGRQKEVIHLSSSDCVKGEISIGERRSEIDSSSFSARRTWKKSSFPLKREIFSFYIYGREEKSFSILYSVQEKKCVLLDENSLITYNNVEMKKESDSLFLFSNNQDTEISFSVFTTLTEKTGPFRQNRKLNYGLFSGKVGSFSFSDAFGCLEL